MPTLLALALSACSLCGADKSTARGASRSTYPPVLPGASVETYKIIGTTNLQLYLFTPKDHAPTNCRPAIVFFFGGGWTHGSPQQFEKHCEYFASRGMVAITADYRVASRQRAKPLQGVADARSAIRWVRKNAVRLGIDPNRIVAAGGSAGGHLAACTACLAGLDEPGEDTSLSARPNALVLFNPVLVLAPLDGNTFDLAGSRLGAERMGVEPRQLSPAHHVRPGAPPALIFHGRADTTVPFATAEAFTAKMKASGNRCELVGFDGQKHGFFNYGHDNNRFFLQTLKRTDEFLASLGYLSGQTPKPRPGSVDLRPSFEQWGLKRSLQGDRPTCSVFTLAGALEFAVAKRQGHGTRLSVEFLNWAANQTCGQSHDGGFFSDLWKGFTAFGICTAEDFPYRTKFEPSSPPPAQALADAKTHLAFGLRINWLKEWNVKTGLTDAQRLAIQHALCRGWPVCGGLRWPKREQWVNDVLQMCPPDAVRDGHSVLLVGYRDEPGQPGGGVFIFRNTSHTGRDGFMPYAYAQAYMNDALWIDCEP